MNRTGYKEMLRDRCPTVVNFALIWCKAKTSWINHVYKNSIGIYNSKKDKNEATRIILGISKKNRNGFEFKYTITWDNLSEEETKIWKSINNWVTWFQKSFLTIYDEYEFLYKQLKTEEEIKNILIRKFINLQNKKDSEKLALYLIECCKKYA